MSVAAVLFPVAMSTAVLFTPAVRYFPGGYYESSARNQVQTRAMTTWPGPALLVTWWNSGELEPPHRMALLLGAAAHHDPRLLPVYMEAIVSDDPRIRQAAAYGYRDLLGDLRPDVSQGVDPVAARELLGEMEAVASTVEQQPLVALWLQSALRHDGRSLPGYSGVTFRRQRADCLRAVDRLLRIEDLPLLIQAWRISGDRSTKISLLHLIEAVTLQRFVEIPRGVRRGWQPDVVYADAFRRLDSWLESIEHRGCDVAFEEATAHRLRTMGFEVDDVQSPEACFAWLTVLRKGGQGSRAMAIRQLYLCGGPWMETSVLRANTDEAAYQRERVLNWYGMRPKRAR